MKKEILAVGICMLMLLVVFSSGCIDFGGEEGEGKDTTPPTISGVTASSITDSGATITWTANEASSSVVEYGTSTSYGSTATGTDGVTSHSVTLSGLSAGTTYHYRAKSADSSGNTVTSGDYTFTTPEKTPEKIYIYGNADFTSANSVTGGSGIEADPYIIEDLNIDATTGTGIEIRNTDAYFVIRNCVVHSGRNNANEGIFFDNVLNGRIDNVALYNNNDGIWLNSGCSNNIISNCSIHDNYFASIWFYDNSSNNKIVNCDIYNNDVSGILIGIYSNNNQILDCTIYNNDGGAITIRKYSNNNQIINCTTHNNGNGIKISDNSSYNQITNSDVYNNGIFGIWVERYSNYNKIIDCNVHNNTEFGVRIWQSSSYNQIYHNNFADNIKYNGWDDSYNSWDNGAEGNYWDDYTGVDDNNDGVGDPPYDISGGDNQDRYPLMSPVE